MKCPACGYDCMEETKTCGLCGELFEKRAPAALATGTAVVEREVRVGPPRHVIDKYRAAEDEQRRLAEVRRRENTKGYLFAGAGTFAAISIIFGLPNSLHPLTLIFILVMSTLFGAPVGFLIGRSGGGMLKGAAISSGFFAVLQLLLSIPLLIKGADVGATLTVALVKGILAGVIPGVIIGWHVDMNE